MCLRSFKDVHWSFLCFRSLALLYVMFEKHTFECLGTTYSHIFFPQVQLWFIWGTSIVYELKRGCLDASFFPKRLVAVQAVN